MARSCLIRMLPSPSRFTKLTSFDIRLHCGTTPDGQDFEGYLGKDGYNNHIITTFDDFLHETFRKCDLRWGAIENLT